MTESIRSTSIYRFDFQRSTAILRFSTSHLPPHPPPSHLPPPLPPPTSHPLTLPPTLPPHSHLPLSSPRVEGGCRGGYLVIRSSKNHGRFRTSSPKGSKRDDSSALRHHEDEAPKAIADLHFTDMTLQKQRKPDTTRLQKQRQFSTAQIW